MGKRVSAKRRLVRGNAGNYIKHNVIRSGDTVVLACRVSGHTQHRGRNDANQRDGLREKVERLGGEIVGVVCVEAAGFDPCWIRPAVIIARQHGAIIVAESTDRFVRHPAFHSKKAWRLQARECDLQELALFADGVTLVTILHPNALPEEVRQHQTNRGLKSKNKRGGRPATSEQKKLRDGVWKLIKTLPLLRR